MTNYLLMYPDRSIPFVKDPSVGQVREVLQNPAGFGDVGEIGGLELRWGEDTPLKETATRVADFSRLPPHRSLRFFLGVPGYSLVLYSDKCRDLYQKVLGGHGHFESEVFFADDCGGCEMELDRADLMTIEEARELVEEFIGNEGQISSAYP